MFVDAQAGCRGVEDLLLHEAGDYKIYWRGLIYSPGVSAGLPCVARLAGELQHRTLEQLASELRGCFLLLVRHQPSGVCQVLVDNSGLYQVFYSDQGISGSFSIWRSFRDSLHPEPAPKLWSSSSTSEI